MAGQHQAGLAALPVPRAEACSSFPTAPCTTQSRSWVREQPSPWLKRRGLGREGFILPSGSKAFRLMHWSRSHICSTSSRAGNSDFKRTRHSFANPSVCLHSQHGVRGDGAAQSAPHTSALARYLHRHPHSHHPLPEKAGAWEPAGTPCMGPRRAAKPQQRL